MNDLLTTIGSFIPAKYVPFLALLPLVGRAYDAIRNGGGLRGVWRSIWLGRSVDTPEAVAKDAAPVKPVDPVNPVH